MKMNCRRSNETAKVVLQNRLMQRRQGRVQWTPEYWLYAHRYTGSTNRIQALKENMGDLPTIRYSDTVTAAEVGRAIVVLKRL